VDLVQQRGSPAAADLLRIELDVPTLRDNRGPLGAGGILKKRIASRRRRARPEHTKCTPILMARRFAVVPTPRIAKKRIAGFQEVRAVRDCRERDSSEDAMTISEQLVGVDARNVEGRKHQRAVQRVG